MRIIPLLHVMACAAVLPAQARQYVDATRPTTGDGRSWSTAFRTLQEALAGAGANTQVWVAAGTYIGGFVIPASVSVLGGFVAGDTRLTQRAPQTQRTILDGADTQRVLTLASGCVVDGCTITHGNAPAPGGGGALADGTNPTITNCWFVDNRNSGGRGSAFAIYNGGAPRVENCVFARNNGAGHVIDVNSSGGVYRNLVVADNVSNGLHFQAGSSPQVENCAFVNNTGFGLCHINTTDTPTLLHCLLIGNRAGHILVPTGALTSIAAVNALPYARNNVSADPLFVNPGLLDYHVGPTSPVIDSGLGTLTNDTPEDLFGGARVLDGDLNGTATIDIGVHEVSHVRLTLPPQATRGSPLALTLSGTAGLAGGVFLGSDAGALFLPPFGHLRIAPAAPFLILSLGALPAQTTLPVPLTLQPSSALYWQGFALAPTGGNVTGLADVTVR